VSSERGAHQPKIAPHPLPVEAQLPEILRQLDLHKRLVLTAEPGAGKSTKVPQKLAAELAGKVLVLEPRRVAARLLASYVSKQCGSPLGTEVGYHVRYDRKATQSTRLVYITEALLRRYIQADPFLSDVAAVVIDEFHERSLHADIGLMLLKKIQKDLRPDLRILVMSATLDARKASAYLDAAPVIEVPGRSYPVEIRYMHKIQNIVDANEISLKALAALRMLFEDPNDDAGHVLIFLPGQREIRALETVLNQNIASLRSPHGKDLVVYPLFSQLPDIEIQKALEPRSDIRKILLATNIAESSLTLDGLSAVIDSGLQKRSNISSPHLVPTLESTRISQASADQRSGRAGRQAPGRAVRLWSASDHRFLELYEIPEVQRSDPSAEVLGLIDLGFESCLALPWIDAPRDDILKASSEKLRVLGLIEPTDINTDRVSAMGRRVLEAPLDLRWSLFVETLLDEAGSLDEPSLLRACVSDLSPRDRDGELDKIIEHKASLIRNTPTFRSLKKTLAFRYQPHKPLATDVTHKALLKSFVDRLARVRRSSEPSKAILWGQRGLRLPSSARDDIHAEEFLLALDIDDPQTSSDDSRLRSFQWISRKTLETGFASRIHERSWAERDSKSGTMRFFRAKFLDDFAIQDPAPAPADPHLLKQSQIQEFLEQWPAILSGNTEIGQFLRRLQLWGRLPSLSQIEETLNSIETVPSSHNDNSSSATLIATIEALFTYQETIEFNSRFPKAFNLPMGRERLLDYRPDGRVFLSTRLQDLFGCMSHPSINNGQTLLHVELLSPAGRPMQITQDLPNFWKSSYHQIRKEMKARYPKHSWPENPSSAE
jgi:ATP-dependent helicase HrpB